jgi:hypothetical protein
MKLKSSLLFPWLLAVAHGLPEPAKVFIYPEPRALPGGDTPQLSSSLTRLVLAQRLGVAEYHDIKDVDQEATVFYVNAFGGSGQQMLNDKKRPHQLVILLEGLSPELTIEVSEALGVGGPAFEIKDSASLVANQKFVEDISAQMADSRRGECLYKQTQTDGSSRK